MAATVGALVMNIMVYFSCEFLQATNQKQPWPYNWGFCKSTAVDVPSIKMTTTTKTL